MAFGENMKTLTAIFALGLASSAVGYTVQGWTETETQAVITGLRRESNARQWLISNLESLTLGDAKAVLKFKTLAEGSPTSGHPAAGVDSLRGKELVLSKRSDTFFLEVSGRSCIYVVKSIDAKAVFFAYEWEGTADALGVIQIDRADFFLRPDDIPKAPNQTRSQPNGGSS